jgi:hypothetical protein
MDNGPLVYYPGSHKLPWPTWEEIYGQTGEEVRRPDFDSHGDFMNARRRVQRRYFKELIERHGLQPEYGTIRKGQAMIWAANLLHGGSHQNDEHRTRHSQVTHYFFEGARVFTPMLTENGRNRWDYPEWVRDPVPRYSPELLRETVRNQVTPGACVLIATGGDAGLLDIDGVQASHFPQGDDGAFDGRPLGGGDLVEQLERLRAEGAQFIVFPKDRLLWLEHEQPELQDVLETRHRAVLRDGAVAAVYALE